MHAFKKSNQQVILQGVYPLSSTVETVDLTKNDSSQYFQKDIVLIPLYDNKTCLCRLLVSQVICDSLVFGFFY